MKKFTSVYDLPSLKEGLEQAFFVKKNPYDFQCLGKNKTMILMFFNSSLRTRLSTQKAAENLGIRPPEPENGSEDAPDSENK